MALLAEVQAPSFLYAPHLRTLTSLVETVLLAGSEQTAKQAVNIEASQARSLRDPVGSGDGTETGFSQLMPK